VFIRVIRGLFFQGLEKNFPLGITKFATDFHGQTRTGKEEGERVRSEEKKKKMMNNE
jgi:hypothetical protein